MFYIVFNSIVCIDGNNTRKWVFVRFVSRMRYLASEWWRLRTAKMANEEDIHQVVVLVVSRFIVKL